MAGRIKWPVKPSAQPTLVRIQDLPPPAQTAPELPIGGRGPISFVSGCVRPRPAVYGCFRRIRGEVSLAIFTAAVVAESLLDPAPVQFLSAHDALGIDPQQHVDALSRPLGDLRRINARIEPGGKAGVALVVRARRSILDQ